MRRTPYLIIIAVAVTLGSVLGPAITAGAVTATGAITGTPSGFGAWAGIAPSASQQTAPQPFVISGTPATEGQYPFLALLLIKATSGTGYTEYCGGSLVAEQWVLTAAHCVTGDSPATPDAVLIGRMVASDTGVGDLNHAGQIFVDPAWDRATLNHDAALIHLTAPSPGPEIHVVDEGQDAAVVAGTQASVIGVGLTNASDSTSQPSTVQMAPQSLLSDAQCSLQLGAAFLSETMMCAGQPNVGPCFGDSGGPLFVASSTGPVEVALVSHGSQDCATTPSVYTRLSAERTWIRQTIAALPGPMVRLAGGDRDATAVAISASSFGASSSAGAVVLANQASFADAIPGAPLAIAKHAPLLLTSAGALDAVTAGEIRRVLAPGGTVYLLGGPVALSPAVESTLTAMGYVAVRYGGANRFATAVVIADQGLANPARVIEATGFNFADALSGGPAAAVSHAAILLTNDRAQAPETAAYLSAHPSDSRTALGGWAAAADPTAAALVGVDRFATSVLVAQAFFAQPTVFATADGLAFPDALAGGASIGAQGGPLLLVPPAGPLPQSVVDWFAGTSAKLTTGSVYGGPSAVAPNVVGEIIMLIS